MMEKRFIKYYLIKYYFILDLDFYIILEFILEKKCNTKGVKWQKEVKKKFRRSKGY